MSFYTTHRHLLLCTMDHEEECPALWDLCHVKEQEFITREEFIEKYNHWEQDELERAKRIIHD